MLQNNALQFLDEMQIFQNLQKITALFWRIFLFFWNV